MIPGRIADATVQLGAPEGWDEARDGPCAKLDVRIRGSVFTSCWEPTPDEVVRLAAGAKVYLHIAGGQPPVALTVGEAPRG